MLRIKKGENALIRKFLKRKDKTNFNRSEFSGLTLSLLQQGREIQAYSFPSAYLRAGTALNEIEIEITTSVSLKFQGGKVVAKFIFVVPDLSFVDSTFTDIITEEILDVENTP